MKTGKCCIRVSVFISSTAYAEQMRVGVKKNASQSQCLIDFGEHGICVVCDGVRRL